LRLNKPPVFNVFVYLKTKMFNNFETQNKKRPVTNISKLPSNSTAT